MPEKTSLEKLESLRARRNELSIQQYQMKNEYADLRHSREEGAEEKRENMKKEFEKLAEEISSIDKEIEKLGILIKIKNTLAEASGYLPFIKEVIEMSKGDVIEVIKLLPDTFIEVRKELEPQLAELSLINAKALFRDYKNLRSAGFKKDEAFRIILAKSSDVFNFSEIIGKVVKNADVKIKK